MHETSASAAAAQAVQVVAAVIIGADGRFLLAQRPPGKVYSGYWEFPGGKIEPGEEPAAALARELHEELGIRVAQAFPWITRHYVYEHAAVELHFFRVTEFLGEPHGREAQALAWQSIRQVEVAPLLPANGPILAALRLPEVYALTDAESIGRDRALRALDAALARGLRLIQVREPGWSRGERRSFVSEVVRRAQRQGARVLVNAEPDLAAECAADGVHLKAWQLRTLSERPALPLVGASCHDAEELRLARALGADFVALGPVAPTASHPGAAVLGWERFGELVRGFCVPVYALGGMTPEDLHAAWARGAHGIAMQRAAWR